MTAPSHFTRVSGGVTAPQGFRACGLHVGIKKRKKDLALIVSDTPAAVAGVFTTNRVQAAPVALCKEHLAGGVARAVLVNSGNANACTGERGLADAHTMAILAAEALGVEKRAVFVCSTGTIGIPLPMETVTRGIRAAAAALSPSGGPEAAEAIMTTDTRPKEIAVQVAIEGRPVTIAGMAKGAGMIHPNMATLLAFLTTDAAVEPAALQSALGAAVETSFNRISVDGDRSTNDTVLCLANGRAGHTPLRPRHPAWRAFREALDTVTRELALMIVRDGEGATKLVTLTVRGAPGRRAAEKTARAIANSLLVKTSWFGADPNWGRVIAAVGYAGAPVRPELIEIRYNDLTAVRHGQPAGVSPDALHQIIAAPEFAITVDLHLGQGAYTVYTCDCSAEYVRINASYMT